MKVLMNPLPSILTFLIISSVSSSVYLSPKVVIICLNSLSEIILLPSLSKILKTSIQSSSVWIFQFIYYIFYYFFLC